MRKKKLFIVKREVLAYNIQDAAKNKGVIYCIELAADNLQPVEENKIKGLSNKKIGTSLRRQRLSRPLSSDFELRACLLFNASILSQLVLF